MNNCKLHLLIFKALQLFSGPLVLDLELFGFAVRVFHHGGLGGRATIPFSFTYLPTGLVVINKEEKS